MAESNDNISVISDTSANTRDKKKIKFTFGEFKNYTNDK
jgi:hypothetical protein